MAHAISCQIRIVADRPRGRRSVGFLIFDSEPSVNAKRKHERLKITDKQMFSAAFDDWADGQVGRLGTFHEFKEPYNQCCYFQYQHHRLYGFLCHPKQSSPTYKQNLCVLVAYAAQRMWERDEEILNLCVRVQTNIAVRRAITNCFPGG